MEQISEQEREEIIARIHELGELILRVRTNDGGEGFARANEMYALAQSIQYEEGIAGARVMFAANEYYRLGNVKTALEHLQYAEGVLAETKSPSLTWLYTIYGNIYWRMGVFDQGFEYIEKAIIAAGELQDKTGMGWTIYIQASFYLEMKQLENAEQTYLRAYHLFIESNDLEGYASTLCGLGNVAFAHKDYQKAVAYYEQALPTAQDNRLLTVVARAYNDLGTAYEHLEDYKQALHFLHRGYVLRVEGKNLLGMSTTELNLGRVYGLLDDTENALFYYQKAVESSTTIMANPRLQRAYQGIAEMYKKLDMPREALEYYEKYMAVHTIVVGEENDAKYANLEAKHDLEKSRQEAEIHKLKNIELKRANDLIAEQNQYIIEEKIKSERLLLNILPEEVAEELKEKGQATPKHYEQATVVFTDFKGFTRLVEQMQPQQIIEDLNTCFLAFDEICEAHGLEKIKTIGDAYMAVGGIPVKNNTNAFDAVRAGLAMQDFMEKWRQEKEAAGLPAWALRVGIHTGSIVAGVIGKNKFAYDVWGDAVNIASRMESSGEVGKVNISQTTYEIVKDTFACEARGRIQAKNKGEIEMYFVTKAL